MSPSTELVELESLARPAPAPAQFEAVQTVIQAMRAEVDYPFTLGIIAEIANYSPFHFARLFREVVGIPPGEYLAAIRFEKAKELILRTDLSVTDICFEVGFSSLGTFSSRFKHLVGASPAELRRLPELIDRHGPPCCQDPERFQRLDTAATYISGTIHGEHVIDGHIYIGLFEDAIAQSLPVCGTRLSGTGAFVLPPAPSGTFWLMAAVLPASSDPLDQLLPGRSIQVASDRTPVVIAPGHVQAHRHLFLRPVRSIDSPILTALPPLAMNLHASRAH